MRKHVLCQPLSFLFSPSCSGQARQRLSPSRWSTPAPSSPSTHLTIKTYDGKTLTLSPEELAALPHKSVSVFNAHSKANETYSGVPLADLLGKVGVPLGESVRGKLFLTGVVASGMDGYGVLYSLAEVDPSIHTGDVIVADYGRREKVG